ncbi:MAG: permease [Rikenellaceae bacterium]
MIEFVKTFLEELILIFNSMSVYLLFGFLIAGILKVYVPQGVVEKLMGGGDLKSVTNAALIGVPLPLCSCGVIPAGVALYRNGASKGASVSFLISTPQTGVDSILITYSLIGLPFAIMRVVVAFITGVIGGVATNIVEKESNTHKPEISKPTAQGDRKGGVKEVLNYGFREFLMSIAKWLLQGMVLAALLSTIIPDGFFTTYLDNELLSMVIVLAASVPLYICATGSVPIVAVLMMKGLSPGAALILLMAGPATNAATINVIRQIFGNKTLLSYLASIIGGALIFGFIINGLLPEEWFDLSPMSNISGAHHMLNPYISWCSTALLLGLIAYGYIRQYIDSKGEAKSACCSTDPQTHQSRGFAKQPLSPLNKPNTQAPLSAQGFSFAVAKKYSFRVEGMTCNHCKMTLEKGIKGIKDVHSATASPSECRLDIMADNISIADVERIILEHGFIYKGEYLESVKR